MVVPVCPRDPGPQRRLARLYDRLAALLHGLSPDRLSAYWKRFHGDDMGGHFAERDPESGYADCRRRPVRQCSAARPLSIHARSTGIDPSDGGTTCRVSGADVDADSEGAESVHRPQQCNPGPNDRNDPDPATPNNPEQQP